MGVEGFPSASFIHSFFFFFFATFIYQPLPTCFTCHVSYTGISFLMRQYAQLSFESASSIPNKKDPDVRVLVISLFIHKPEVITALFFSVLDSVFKGLKQY